MQTASPRVFQHPVPNPAWLALRRDAFDELYEFKMRHSLATWELAIENLLAGQREKVTT